MHVIQRGNNRATCFHGAVDYLTFLHYLGQLAPQCECAIHAYVLMTNHVHLLITPKSEDGSSQMMKHLGQHYVQYFNRTHQRTGTLWEGRFRSSIVEGQVYLFRCYRYIEMNPVRAGIVKHPREYPWSSYCHNAESSQHSPILLTPHEEYCALGRTDDERRAAYGSLFEEQLDGEQLEEIRSAANGGYALGGTQFRAEVAAILGRRAGPGASGRPRREKPGTDHGFQA